MSPARSPDQTAPDASMKSEGLAKQILITFALTALLYLIIFQTIEYRRNRNGPWQVTFTHDTTNAPSIIINQPTLGITNTQISFVGESNLPSLGRQTFHFGEARVTPFNVPFGKCVFLDTTFLPGTVALNLFDHEVQLLPRVVTIDKVERPWRSGETISVSRSKKPAITP